MKTYFVQNAQHGRGLSLVLVISKHYCRYMTHCDATRHAVTISAPLVSALMFALWFTVMRAAIYAFKNGGITLPVCESTYCRFWPNLLFMFYIWSIQYFFAVAFYLGLKAFCYSFVFNFFLLYKYCFFKIWQNYLPVTYFQQKLSTYIM